MCAFLSLIFSGIKPIIDFGLMMSFGLLTSFIVTFSLLPTLLNLFDYQKIGGTAGLYAQSGGTQSAKSPHERHWRGRSQIELLSICAGY